MDNTVRISREAIRKAFYPNWYIYDTLKEEGFPFKLKPPTQGLCRVKDLEFADVELLGNFKRNDDVCTGDMVFEFETYFDLDVDNLRSDFSKQFLGDKYEMSKM